jgi:hypothetical protein
VENWIQRLETINRILEEIECHFAYRVRDEIVRYMAYAHDFIEEIASKNMDLHAFTMEKAFDYQVMQKILPRISGSREELDMTLSSLAELFENEGLQMSHRKIQQMQRKSERLGFTSYWIR